MFRFSHSLRRAVFAVVCLLPLIAAGQTLNINNDSQTYATLTNTVVTLTGRAELRITGTGDPIPGCTIHLNSPDAWFYLTNIVPSTVSSTFLSRVRVNGANAVLDSNVRVVQYAMGAVVIPHAPSFAPLEVFDGRYFTGSSKQLDSYVDYNDVRLGDDEARRSVRSSSSAVTWRRSRSSENGTGVSRNYVAQDGDLEVGRLPDRPR